MLKTKRDILIFDDEVKEYFKIEYLSFAESILLSKNETLLEK